MPVRTITKAGGGGSTNSGLTDAFSLNIKVAETANPVPTDLATFLIKLLQAETNATQTELVQLKFPSGDFGDSNSIPTETRTTTLRCWATGCTSNDTTTGNTIAPANANGQNDGTFAHLKTGTGTPDTINPATITTGSMNVPGGITVVSALIRVWFKVGAITLAVADNLNITYNTGGGPSGTVWQGPALATLLYPGEDYSTTALSWTKDVSSLTLAQLQALQLVASYNAGVLLAPQTSIEIDSWSVDVTINI
jgi:hypothetical protein